MTTTDSAVCALPPISTLPTEVLCAILEDVVTQRFFSVTTHHRHATFVLLQVCQRWRAIAVDTPQLWSHIHSGFPLRIISALLRNSRTALLSIVINFAEPIESPKKTLPMLLELLPVRVKELQVNIQCSADLCYYSDFLHVVAPHLTNLHFSADPSSPFLPIAFVSGLQCPLLKSLDVDSIILHWSSPLLRNLTALVLKFEGGYYGQSIWVPYILDILRDCPDLESFTLHLYCPMRNLPDPPKSRIGLPHLRSVKLQTQEIEGAHSILSVLDLPLDVRYTLFFKFASAYRQPALSSLPLPSHLTSTSICGALQCYVGYNRVKIVAHVQPDINSESVTQLSICVGPARDLENGTKWLRARRDDHQDSIQSAVGYLDEIVTSNPGFQSISNMTLTFIHGLRTVLDPLKMRSNTSFSV